jgi:Na+/proline symporter
LFCLHRPRLCPVFECQYFQDGRERLQNHAGWRLRTFVFGAFWKRATTQGALAAILAACQRGYWSNAWSASGQPSGTSDYAYALVGIGQAIPPQLIGLGVSVIGMIAGSLLPQRVGHPMPHHDIHQALHHRAAAETHHVGERPHRHNA